MYKYLSDVCNFTLKDDKNAFQWNLDVLEFFNTIKFLGGQKSYNFVRGPGFLDTGKGGVKTVDSLSNFNLCGPSSYALRKCTPDFTCNSGIYSFLLKAFHDSCLFVCLFLLLFVPCQQLWSLRDGQFT